MHYYVYAQNDLTSDALLCYLRSDKQVRVGDVVIGLDDCGMKVRLEVTEHMGCAELLVEPVLEY